MGNWITPITDPVTAMALKLWSYVPNVLAAMIIFFVGILLVRLVAKIIGKALRISKLDTLAEKAGINTMLQTGEIRLTLSGIIEALIYWILVLIVIVTAAQALKFMAAVELISRLISYIPNIIAAVLILAVGLFVASLVGSMVATAAKNAGIKKANLLTQIVKVIVIVFTAALSIEQLQIGTALITQVISILVMSAGAGLALAFGLGCKDIVADKVKNFLNSMK
ncbi:MAG: hypothetical protein WCG78_00645 [Candidatus Omnitrophota bacterium]